MSERVVVLVLAVVVTFLVGVALVQLLPPDLPETFACHFAAYPAKQLFRGKVKAPALGGLDVPDSFRPLVVLAALDGPNFAGAYTVVPYELINSDVHVLVISARTGTVDMAPIATGYVVRHRLNSRLLVYQADPTRRKAEKTRFFEFREGRFLVVKEPASLGDC